MTTNNTNGISVEDIQWAMGRSAWAEMLRSIELKNEIVRREQTIAQQEARIKELEKQ